MTEPHQPDFLTEGDTIGIVAPSRKISLQELQPAIDFLIREGFKVKLGERIFAESHQFAGTDTERADDFNDMLHDDSVKAILAARGGYGAVRIVEQLDFDYFSQHPKWLCGYSDFTVFHSQSNRYKVSTIHGTMPVSFADTEAAQANAKSLIDALTGKALSYSPQPHPLNRGGNVRAEVVGGNLSILYSLTGTPSAVDTRGKILFIEDLDEYLYHIDRMMWNLKRAGMLENLAGLIVGGLSDMHDNTIPFGQTAEEIVASCCSEYDYPVCFNFPAGHGALNRSIRLGTPMDIQFNANQFIIHN